MKHTAEALAAFDLQALGFCEWSEGDSLGTQPEIDAATWLAKLHASALALPETEPEYEDDLSERVAESLQRAKKNLGHFDGWYYRTIFDPDPTNTDEPVMGDIGDDLLDTYKDVKLGLVHYKRGQVKQALWYWSFMHRMHWGKHATGAMAALQALASASDR